VPQQFSINWMHKENMEKYLPRFKGQPVHFIEIGSFEGMTTCWLIDNFLTHPEASITAIDPCTNYPIPGFDRVINDGLMVRFLNNTQHHRHKIKFYRNTSTAALPTLPPDHFSFIYVDGDHRPEIAYQDGVLSWPLLKRGGIMIFDDYHWLEEVNKAYSPCEGVDRFVREFKPIVLEANRDNQVVVEKP